MKIFGEKKTNLKSKKRELEVDLHGTTIGRPRPPPYSSDAVVPAAFR
jgi:hypothetical protein